MYTMLMMMAVSSGGDASAFGGRNKGGCNGDAGSCTGMVASAGCDGGRGGFLGHRNKNSCHGSSACYGTAVSYAPVAPVASCTGAVVASSCHGSSCDGGKGGFLGLRSRFGHKNSCHGSGACYGTAVGYDAAPAAGCTGGMVAPMAAAPAVVMPPAMKEMPKKEEVK